MNGHHDLDFDALCALAQHDPAAFESHRARVIQAAIERAPAGRRQRLHRLQWRVDQVRRRSATPLAACISLSDMMWESVTGEHGLLETLRGQPRERVHRSDAVILPMRPRRRR